MPDNEQATETATETSGNATESEQTSSQGTETEVSPKSAMLAQYGLTEDDLKGDQAAKQSVEKSETDKALSPEEMLAKLAEDQAGDKAKAADQVATQSKELEFINSLGLKHGDNPIKIESQEKLKEFIEKGFDYTKKTQEFSDERKNVETLLEKRISEFENERVQNAEFLELAQKHDYSLQRMATLDPDLYEQVVNFGKTVQDEHLNPYTKQLTSTVESLKKQNEALEQKFNKALESLENKGIVRDWEAEKQNLSTKTFPQMKVLGIEPDLKKVQEAWAKNEGMNAEAAFYSVYGSEIQKRYQSKMGLVNADKKLSAAKVSKGVGSVKSGKTGKSEADIKRMNEFEYAHHLAAQYSA